MSSLIECVPNFSEGRRSEVIDALVAAVLSEPGVLLLDRQSDADHNRSVLTFAGSPAAVLRAAFAATRVATALIDLNLQRGEHPRIGATDVVPFVPLQNASIEQCIELAHHFGRRVAEELGLPVYLYEAAAQRPDRVALPDVRRGEYEGLREVIASDPQRAPDYGPAQLGPAGAIAVGARRLLIAYNIYLNSPDLSIARRIARLVRERDGGLRNVRALGLLVGGRAQVSLNLLNFEQTPPHRVLELVRREAAAYGVSVAESELVGLIPERALNAAARYYLQLHGMAADQVLEQRIASAAAQRSASGGTQLRMLEALDAAVAGLAEFESLAMLLNRPVELAAAIRERRVLLLQQPPNSERRAALELVEALLRLNSEQ